MEDNADEQEEDDGVDNEEEDDDDDGEEEDDEDDEDEDEDKDDEEDDEDEEAAAAAPPAEQYNGHRPNSRINQESEDSLNHSQIKEYLRKIQEKENELDLINKVIDKIRTQFFYYYLLNLFIRKTGLIRLASFSKRKKIWFTR